MWRKTNTSFYLIILWFWFETRYTKLLRLFGVKLNTDYIPNGMYCYEQTNNQIKTCKYYRSTPKTKGIACTYIGYMGFDICLHDQCKICEIKN